MSSPFKASALEEEEGEPPPAAAPAQLPAPTAATPAPTFPKEYIHSTGRGPNVTTNLHLLNRT